jgi:glycosyltransferase involved in cell wall biosynthesis
VAAPISVVVLTWNEERNLSACLESVAGWVTEILVVDSGSTDATRAIAERFGATLVTHPFETHARQWTWALSQLPVPSDWVLALDADQRVTPELRDELRSLPAQASADAPAGYFIKRRQIFRGVWIRHGGYYPKYLLKLFRRGAVTIDEADLVDHHFSVRGATAKLAGDLVEDNRNEAAIAAWTSKHNHYAQLQARQEVRERTEPFTFRIAPLFGSPDARTRWVKQLWIRLPLYVRPCVYFTYRYVLRLGFLDGTAGFVFHVLQAFWYRLLVDVNVDELRRLARSEAASVAAADAEARREPLEPAAMAARRHP